MKNYSQEAFIVDKFTGSLHAIGLPSKRTEDIFVCVMNFLNVSYAAYGWRTEKFYVDAETCLDALRIRFATVGVVLLAMAPEDHASMVERYTQEMDKRATAILIDLPYLLPPSLMLNLHQHVSYQMNLLPNDRTFQLSVLSTPFLLRTKGTNPVSPIMTLAFGDLCIIKLGNAQKEIIRRDTHHQKQLVPRAGYGVFLGRVANNSTTMQFLQSNGLIITRRDYTVLKGYIPFGWEEKPAVVTRFKSMQDPNIMLQSTLPDTDSNSDDLTEINVNNVDMPSNNEAIPTDQIQLPLATTNEVIQPLQSCIPQYDPDSISVNRPSNNRHVTIDMSKNTYNDQQPSTLPIPQYVPGPVAPPEETIQPIQTEINDPEQRRSVRISTLPAINYAASATTSNLRVTNNTMRPVSDGIKRNNKQLDEKKFYPFIDQVSKDLDSFKNPNHPFDGSNYEPDILKKPQHQKGVHSQASAMKYDRKLTAMAVDTEMKKLERYGVMTAFSYKNLLPGDVVMQSFLVFRLKLNALTAEVSKMTARLAVNGKTQPSHTYMNTFAATADQNKVTAARAAFVADAAKKGKAAEVYMKDLDICGAFLHAKYESKLGTRLFMKLPKDLPGIEFNTLHPLAGKLVRLEKALYGLPEANMLFEAQRNIAIEKSGFKAIESDGSIFVKKEGDKHSILFVHVDDFQIISNCLQHWDTLVQHLTERFQELEINEVSEQHVGITCEFSKVDPGVFRLSQAGYINKMVESVNVPYSSSSPSKLDLFSDTTNTAPYNDINYYQKLIGMLIYALATRTDIRKEVIFLASKSAKPTVGDMMKLTKVFAYLKQNPNLGPLFDSKDGAILKAHADAAFNNHADCRSQGASFLSIGDGSAAFAAHSRKITTCVVLSSMEAEYVTLSETARTAIYMRRFLSDIGFPQESPTIIYEDNSSAISLASCSNIPKKSRHILLRYHFIKYAVESGQVEVHFIDTKRQRADFFTKVLSTPDFIKGRSDVLNLSKQDYYFPTPTLKTTILKPRSGSRSLPSNILDPKHSTSALDLLL